TAHSLMWIGFAGLLVSAMSPSGSASARKISGLFLILFSSAFFHSMSVDTFRWFYDGNPLVVLCIAQLVHRARCFTAGRGGRVGARRGVWSSCGSLAVTLLIAAVLFSLYVPRLRSCLACTETWPEIQHLRGARMRPDAAGMRELVRVVRSLAGRDEAV